MPDWLHINFFIARFMDSIVTKSCKKVENFLAITYITAGFVTLSQSIIISEKTMIAVGNKNGHIVRSN
jgi:hypothetical protein